MAKVKDIRVSFIGKDSDGKEKHVAVHVHDVEKALAAIEDNNDLGSLAADVKNLSAVGADVLENYDDAHKVEISKHGYQDGSDKYPFKADAE